MSEVRRDSPARSASMLTVEIWSVRLRVRRRCVCVHRVCPLAAASWPTGQPCVDLAHLRTAAPHRAILTDGKHQLVRALLNIDGSLAARSDGLERPSMVSHWTAGE